jgi:hypothetical protein
VTNKHTILIVARNDGEINADLEIRQIREVLEQRAPLRDRFTIHAPPAMGPGELITQLRLVNPTIVHFICHGKVRKDGNSSVQLTSGSGMHKDLHLPHLRDYLEQRIAREQAPRLACIFLNACFVGAWARQLLGCAEVVIGTESAILDSTARFFSTKFYEHLGHGLGFETSFHDAVHATKSELHTGANEFLIESAAPTAASKSASTVAACPDSAALERLRACGPLVVYVGPELARAAGFPSRRELAERLLAAVPADTSAARRAELARLIEAGKLTAVFTELEALLSPARFGTLIERELDEETRDPPALAEALAELGARVRGVVTPNLDRLIERAFCGRLAPHTRGGIGLGQRRDWLLKTHGTLLERDSWTFTREQQRRTQSRAPETQAILQSVLIHAKMLFVATDPEDPALDAMLDQVRPLSDGALPEHWALLPRDRVTPIVRTNLAGVGIEIIAYNSEAEQLAILRSLAT